ncbi:MAG: alpha/beta hydrolase [Chloroflexi bacterium]|nr:alpha/beta hydrolase [Chloroflexota bacterium]
MAIEPISTQQRNPVNAGSHDAPGARAAQAEAPQTAVQKRRPFRWLARLMVVVLGLIAVGTVYEALAERADIGAYPPPGQMVDVGGFRMHIRCIGAGSPTVVIDAGLGDWSLAWSVVQAQEAATTRVCAYDRAGMGYSEAGPLPRSAEQIAAELHTLLERAGVAGPYVMVGHSLGGLPVRVFVHTYPADVAGVVLIESMSPRQMAEPSDAAAREAVGTSGGSAVPSLLARIGLVRLLADPFGFVRDLQPEARAAFIAFSVTPRSVQAWADEGAALPMSLAQAGSVTSFGDLPLTVLTGRLNQQTGWQAMQAELLQLSPNSQQIVVENSGHNIQMDQPEAAVEAIVNMVSRVR